MSTSVLIIDDDKLLCDALQLMLAKLGFEVETANDAIAGLRKAYAFKPDVILLDVMMPDMSGLEVCRILKNDHRYGDLKIIILSAKGQEKEKEEGIKAGADRYISKPFNYSNLLETIEELLG